MGQHNRSMGFLVDKKVHIENILSSASVKKRKRVRAVAIKVSKIKKGCIFFLVKFERYLI